MTCEHCGIALVVGDWPFCPHGRYGGTVVSDSIRGGQLIENLGPTPVRVYSETHRRQLMKERGLIDAVRHQDGSRLTSNWASVTQASLDNARSLLDPARRRRVPAASRSEHLDREAEVETLTMTVRELESTFTVKAEE
jgi:hypothetical protein